MHPGSGLATWMRLLVAAALAAATSWGAARGVPALGAARAAPGAPRLVSLAPAVTETLFALGAGERVVGVSDYCSGPAAAMARPRMGSSLTPDFERIAAARPSMILTSSTPATRLDGLGALAPTHELAWLTVDDVVTSTRAIGALADVPRAAGALAERLEATLTRTPPADGPRLLLVLGGSATGSELWYVKTNSLHGAAIAAAGARNAVAEPVSGAPVMSLERLIALDPDRIVVLGGGEAGAAATLGALRGVSVLTAVRHDQLGALPDPQLLVPGPRILELVVALQHWVADGAERP